MTDRTCLLDPTPLLDFQSGGITDLIQARRWLALPEHDRIGAAYDFVRNEILFGFTCADQIPAPKALANLCLETANVA